MPSPAAAAAATIAPRGGGDGGHRSRGFGITPAVRVVVVLFLCGASFRLGRDRSTDERAAASSAPPLLHAFAHGPAAAAATGGGDEDCLQRVAAKMGKRISARLSEEDARGAKSSSNESGAAPMFPKTTSAVAEGALRVSRRELMDAYDFGVPFQSDRKVDDDDDVWILYSSPKAMPEDRTLKRAATHGAGTATSARIDVAKALVNCEALNVIFEKRAGNRRPNPSCRALVGGYGGYQANKWMRMPEFTDGNKKVRALDRSLPLRHVGRVVAPSGIDEFGLPMVWHNQNKKQKGFVLQHLDSLRTFLENVGTVLDDLRALLERRGVAKDATLVVMTVNEGQSDLLKNFVCNARAKGFDLSNLLVFPTDVAAEAVAESLNVATYYDAKNFAIVPSGEAMAYGDPTFAAVMYAKVVCVAYGTLLGRDVLFQDVDVVWFKDPVAFFRDKSNKELQDFDVMFQHDGSPQPRYAPFSANSGFYYVRHNKKTQYLFTSLLYHGALVRQTKSHQQVLVQTLSEHSSLFGIKVKVFDKWTTDLFPGGYHFHQDWDAMRKIVGGTSNAYVFHMSWTENKKNKLLFLRQLGEWYVRDECVVEIGGLSGSDCCSREPLVTCHYRDKPSKVPCNDSPAIDAKKSVSFWK